MRLRAGDIFGGEAAVKIYRGSDAAHDLTRRSGKTAAPYRTGRFARAGHRPHFRAHREDELMKWTVAAASIFLLVAPTLGAADEGEVDMPDRTKLGEFVPSTQPRPAPAISFADTSGHSVELSELQGKLVIVNLW